VQKYHTIDGRRCEVKKALSKLEMRNLKDAVGMPGQGMPWPVGGCGPTGGNMCNVGPMNYGAGCNVGGFGANCNFGGAGKCGIGMNNGNQMGKIAYLYNSIQLNFSVLFDYYLQLCN